MEKITISASLKHKELIRQAIGRFSAINIQGLFPNLDSEIKKEDVTLAMLRELEQAHFEAIDQSFGLYVIDPGGVVGTLVSVEVGYARALRKPIYFSETPLDSGLQVLAAQVIALDRIAEGSFLS